jgi:hypothetical protein
MIYLKKSWNDYFGVGMKTWCGRMYLNGHVGFFGMVAAYL